MDVIGNRIGVPLEADGNIPTVLHDQETDLVDLYLHIERVTGNLVAVNTSVDDTIVTLTPGHGALVDDAICLKEGTRFYQGVVLTVNVNEVTLDTPLDFAFTTETFVCSGTPNLHVDGSVTPQIAKIRPPIGANWDVVRLMFHMQSTTAMDAATFGGIPALTNGIVLRRKNGAWKNLFNVKTNGEFGERAYDIGYDDKAPAGEFGFRCRRTFGGQSKNGVVVKLYGADSDELQVIIRDDLTGLSLFRVIAQGHVSEEL